MDTTPCHCVMRFVGYTVAITAVMVAPALLQAVLIMRPGVISMANTAAVMSCALAAAVVMVPALLQNLVTGHR